MRREYVVGEFVFGLRVLACEMSVSVPTNNHAYITYVCLGNLQLAVMPENALRHTGRNPRAMTRRVRALLSVRLVRPVLCLAYPCVGVYQAIKISHALCAQFSLHCHDDPNSTTPTTLAIRSSALFQHQSTAAMSLLLRKMLFLKR